MTERSKRGQFARLKARARAGDVEAQLALARHYCGTNGQRSDYRQARIWFERAARAGSTEAMVTLGLLHQRGEGAPKDPRRAAQLLARAAKLGSDTAVWILAHDYEKGIRVRRNLRKAFEWNCYAAGRADVYAMRRAEQLAKENGFELPARRVTTWYRAAAERGDRDALYWFGHRLHDGDGVRRDRRAAVSAWRRAARLGDASSSYCLGLSYELGEGVRQSWPRALACYREAARLGDDDACYEIASYYCWVKKNSRLRVLWLRKAMKRGHNVARCELGVHYIYGDGVRQDMAKAARLYRLSAEQGYSRAMYLLGLCYLEGDGVRRERSSARRWLERAVTAAEKEEDRETVRDARGCLRELNLHRTSRA